MVIDKKTLGLQPRWICKRTDGSSEPGGKHHSCMQFVLDVDHDLHAVPALIAYAASCHEDYPQLAMDLLALAETAVWRYIQDRWGGRPMDETVATEMRADAFLRRNLLRYWR